MVKPRDDEKFLKILETEFPVLEKEKPTISQLANLRQQLLGRGLNNANVVMVGPVVITSNANIEEAVSAIVKGAQFTENPGLQDGIRGLLAEILRLLPEPRLANLNSMVRSIAYEVCDGNRTQAAQFLGVSVRTMRNHREEDGQVKEIEE